MTTAVRTINARRTADTHADKSTWRDYAVAADPRRILVGLVAVVAAVLVANVRRPFPKHDIMNSELTQVEVHVLNVHNCNDCTTCECYLGNQARRTCAITITIMMMMMMLMTSIGIMIMMLIVIYHHYHHIHENESYQYLN